MCSRTTATFFVCTMLVGIPASSMVLFARDEALALAFPDHERIDAENIFLRPSQRQRIEEMARSPLPSDLVRVYRGFGAHGPMGHAFIDTFRVRTSQATLMVVIAPNGRVESIRVLAFYEPPEYLPSQRWLEQMVGAHRSTLESLRLGNGVDGNSGATLTARAALSSVRRTLSTYATAVTDEERP